MYNNSVITDYDKQVLKKTFKKKEDILPLQMSEVETLKGDLESFFLSVREFRNNFRKEAPFAFVGVNEKAYSEMDKQVAMLEEIESQVKG